LVDRNIAITQYSMLANQQQGEYVPFLTSAVNESIRSLFASNDQTLKILKALLPSNGIEALNQGGLSSLTNGTSDPNAMTVAKAVELLKQQGPKPLLEAPDTIKALEERHN